MAPGICKFRDRVTKRVRNNKEGHVLQSRRKETTEHRGEINNEIILWFCLFFSVYYRSGSLRRTASTLFYPSVCRQAGRIFNKCFAPACRQTGKRAHRGKSKNMLFLFY